MATDLNDATRILEYTFLFWVLIVLPGFALCAGAIRANVRGTLKLGLFLMAGIAIPGYLMFWVYLASPRVGVALCKVIPYALAAVLLWLLIRVQAEGRKRVVPLLVPFGLMLFASAGVLSLGYLYGGQAEPDLTGQNRFSHHLPIDNIMPLQFAKGLVKGSVPRPLMADWLSSDRPPLQTGIVLTLEPFMNHKRELRYHIASVILQTLWIPALWLMLRAFRISHVTTAVAIATIYFSGFALVNTFYVWPKLLATGFTLAFAVPVLVMDGSFRRATWWWRVLIAFLLACGLLAHGGSLFALLGICFFVVVRFRSSLHIREVFICAVIVIAFYAPWMGYQKFVDPPGDRLLKWHLAGVEKITPEPAFQTIYNAYRNQNFESWLSAREINAAVLFEHQLDFLNQLGFNAHSRKEMRVLQFFYFMPALGFCCVGVFGLVVKWRGKEIKAARRMVLWALLTAAFSILLEFAPASTVLQSCSYVMVIMAMTGCVLAFRAVIPKIAIVVCVAQCVWMWLVYMPDVQALTVPGYQPVSMNGWMMGLEAISVLGFAGVLALRLGGGRARLEIGQFTQKEIATEAAQQ